MRPSRIIVGEVRQEECLDLLIALNSGLPGMCPTWHGARRGWVAVPTLEVHLHAAVMFKRARFVKLIQPATCRVVMSRDMPSHTG